jgi:hypothetical protein
MASIPRNDEHVTESVGLVDANVLRTFTYDAESLTPDPTNPTLSNDLSSVGSMDPSDAGLYLCGPRQRLQQHIRRWTHSRTRAAWKRELFTALDQLRAKGSVGKTRSTLGTARELWAELNEECPDTFTPEKPWECPGSRVNITVVAGKTYPKTWDEYENAASEYRLKLPQT